LIPASASGSPTQAEPNFFIGQLSWLQDMLYMELYLSGWCRIKKAIELIIVIPDTLTSGTVS
jgi:hypothetical protein